MDVSFLNLECFYQHLDSPADWNSLSGVCKFFKELVDKHSIWEQKAFEWGAADWSPKNLVEKKGYKKLAMSFVARYNTLLISNIYSRFFVSQEIFCDMFAMQEAIDKFIQTNDQKALQVRFRHILENMTHPAAVDGAFGRDVYNPFNAVDIKDCYILLEAGLKIDSRLFNRVIQRRAPLALIKAFNKDKEISIGKDTSVAAIRTQSSYALEVIKYLHELGAPLCNYEEAVHAKCPFEVFELLKGADHSNISSRILCLAFENGLHDARIIQLLVDCLIQNNIKINEFLLREALVHKLPLESMQILLKTEAVQQIIEEYLMRGGKYCEDLMTTGVDYEAPIEILRALKDAGARVKVVPDCMKSAKPESVKAFFAIGGEITEEHVECAKQNEGFGEVLVPMLEDHLAKQEAAL